MIYVYLAVRIVARAAYTLPVLAGIYLRELKGTDASH